jgi:hypothetical protein
MLLSPAVAWVCFPISNLWDLTFQCFVTTWSPDLCPDAFYCRLAAYRAVECAYPFTAPPLSKPTLGLDKGQQPWTGCRFRRIAGIRASQKGSFLSLGYHK